MIAVVTILSAFPLGFLVSNRLAANMTYAIAYLWAFVFQSIYLMLDTIGKGTDPAFEGSEFPLSYGLVTLAIFATGFGLVQLGHRVGRGRRQRRYGNSRSSLPGTAAGASSAGTTTTAV